MRSVLSAAAKHPLCARMHEPRYTRFVRNRTACRQHCDALPNCVMFDTKDNGGYGDADDDRDDGKDGEADRNNPDDAQSPGDDDDVAFLDEDTIPPWEGGNSSVCCNLHLAPTRLDLSANTPSGFNVDYGSCGDTYDWAAVRGQAVADSKATCNVKRMESDLVFDLVAGSGRGCVTSKDTRYYLGLWSRPRSEPIMSLADCAEYCSENPRCNFFTYSPTANGGGGACVRHYDCDFKTSDFEGRVYRRSGITAGDLIKNGPDLEVPSDYVPRPTRPPASTTLQTLSYSTPLSPITTVPLPTSSATSPPAVDGLATFVPTNSDDRQDAGTAAVNDGGSGSASVVTAVVVVLLLVAITIVAAGVIYYKRRKGTEAAPNERIRLATLSTNSQSPMHRVKQHAWNDFMQKYGITIFADARYKNRKALARQEQFEDFEVRRQSLVLGTRYLCRASVLSA